MSPALPAPHLLLPLSILETNTGETQLVKRKGFLRLMVVEDSTSGRVDGTVAAVPRRAGHCARSTWQRKGPVLEHEKKKTKKRKDKDGYPRV